jgi:hypothetical protein
MDRTMLLATIFTYDRMHVDHGPIQCLVIDYLHVYKEAYLRRITSV